jgi:hypothetical protein
MTSPKPNDKIRVLTLTFASKIDRDHYLKSVEPGIINCAKVFGIVVWPEEMRLCAGPKEAVIETNNYEWFVEELKRNATYSVIATPSNLNLTIQIN